MSRPFPRIPDESTGYGTTDDSGLSNKVKNIRENLDLITIITFIVSLPGIILMLIGVGLERIGLEHLGPAIGGIGFLMALSFIMVTGMGDN